MICFTMIFRTSLHNVLQTSDTLICIRSTNTISKHTGMHLEYTEYYGWVQEKSPLGSHSSSQYSRNIQYTMNILDEPAAFRVSLLLLLLCNACQLRSLDHLNRGFDYITRTKIIIFMPMMKLYSMSTLYLHITVLPSPTLRIIVKFHRSSIVSMIMWFVTRSNIYSLVV